jgi:hypothetical protein
MLAAAKPVFLRNPLRSMDPPLSFNTAIIVSWGVRRFKLYPIPPFTHTSPFGLAAIRLDRITQSNCWVCDA